MLSPLPCCAAEATACAAAASGDALAAAFRLSLPPRPRLVAGARRCSRGLGGCGGASGAAAARDPAHRPARCAFKLDKPPRTTALHALHDATRSPVTWKRRYTARFTPPYRPCSARLSHTAAWCSTSRTSDGSNLQAARCGLRSPMVATTVSQWAHCWARPPPAGTAVKCAPTSTTGHVSLMPPHPRSRWRFKCCTPPRTTAPHALHDATPSPVTRKRRHTPRFTPPYRCGSARLSHTAAWSSTSGTSDGSAAHTAMCFLRLCLCATTLSQWAHRWRSPPPDTAVKCAPASTLR